MGNRRAQTKRQERDPDRHWLDHGDWYLEIKDNRYEKVHDVEQLAGYCGPEVLLQTTILKYGDRTEDGNLVKAAAIPWFEILRHMLHNSQFMFHFARRPRKFEEFIAGAYYEAGWQVILTPASGDKGRDVIATKKDLFSWRILDQAKAYSPRRLVRHDDVWAMIGVLNGDQNASKGLITTTSDFAPRVLSQKEFANFIPNRLELRNGNQLLKWLAEIDVAGLSDTKQKPR